ncbi:MAG: hypothetical protein QOD42_3369 [Sphingomonadales bacterium]|jgi:hypothetical protein|nr:hypothetical protein [Sphingomonadales bacterium]
MAETKGPDDRPDALAQFLKQSEDFLATTLQEIGKAMGDSEDGRLVASHAAAANEQLCHLTQYVRQRYQGASVATRRTIDEFMQFQAVTTLARNAQTTFKQMAAKGLFGDGTFGWIESVMHEIKKLLEAILDAFGISLPGWLDKLIQILDEIIGTLLGIFGGSLGLSRTKILSELSGMEVNFWNEMAAQKRFAIVKRSERLDDED